MTVKKAFNTAELPHLADADQNRLTQSFTVLALCWTLFIAGLCFIEYRHVKSFAMELARTDTRSTFNKDLAYRRWATRHGGVYVPITPETQPNAFLAHIPERDITTPSGKKLTLLNPAYMTRQVHELSTEQYGVRGHITSLKPLRPENAPDAWEVKALEKFEAGIKEVSSLEPLDNELYMRMMRPMTTETGCLKCHGHQGYKLGDIRGGISVSVPWKPYYDLTRGQLYDSYWGFGGAWLTGIVGLWFTQRRIQISIFLRKQAEEELQESEERYRQLFESNKSVMLLIDPERGSILDANPASSSFYGWTREELKQKRISDINTLIPEEIAAEMESAKKEDRSHFHFMHRRSDGSIRNVEVYSGPIKVKGRTLLFSIIHDITERRQAEDLIQRSLKEKEVMLKEIHHRVKNNMQVIYSLLNLQSKTITDQTVRAMFEESQDRVHSMALIHEKLYRSADLAHIDFKEYLKSLVTSIAKTYERPDIILSVEMEPLALDVNVGIPCGLIVNELVSNCLKYAFPAGRKGTVTLGIKRNSEGNNILTVADNGIGFPENIDFRNTASLGLQLVNVLTGQIHGTIELLKEEGTTFRITFPGTS